MNDKRLFLIDAYALIYRSYFAMIKTPLSSPSGQPTAALYAFANYLIKLIKDFSCPYLAGIFDSRTPTFRHNLYKEYKANREEMPDDLKLQLPLIDRLMEAFAIAAIRVDGYEADDIIAYLAKKAALEDFEVFIVSKDKDLMQLVSQRVHILAPQSGSELLELGPKEVQEKIGVPPKLIRDYLALTGDPSDNIPGVPGIGPKTALKILENVSGIDVLLQNPEACKNPKIEAKIEEHKKSLLLSLQLVTLKDDLPVELSIESLRAKPINREKCIELFKEMGFNSLLRNPLFATTKESASVSKTIVSSLEQLHRIITEIQSCGFFSIDTETTSILPREAKLVGISISFKKNEAFYIPVGHRNSSNNLDINRVIEALKSILESEKIEKVGQNLKYDRQVFRNYGILMNTIAFDSMIAAYLINPGIRNYSLESLAQQWLGVKKISIEELIGKKGKNQFCFADVTIEKAAEYSCEDAIIPLLLREKMEPLLLERNLMKLFCDVEMPLVSVLADMEWEGILLDSRFCKVLSVEYSQRLRRLSEEIFEMAGEEFNLNSPKQLAEVLFVKLKLPKARKTKTGLSTDEQTLYKLATDYPIAGKILQYRETQKLLSTYIDALPKEVSPISGRIHSSFNQTVTATGRLSSTNPNLQNIPVRTDDGRRIREAFIASDNTVIVSADYSQIELRILAHLSKDPFLVEAFKQDLDIHTQTAAAIYGVTPQLVTPQMRRSAKTINFGLMYGMGPVNLSKQLSISLKEASEFIDAYFKQFPNIRSFMDSCIEKARSCGYSETMLGRRRYLPEINSESRQLREAAQRIAINTPVQGTAADIIKVAMVTIHREMPQKFERAAMLLQVHDELVFEVDSNSAEEFRNWIAYKMSTAIKLDVPLKVETGQGKNWSMAH